MIYNKKQITFKNGEVTCNLYKLFNMKKINKYKFSFSYKGSANYKKLDQNKYITFKK